jgi:hypothetical protein
MESESFDEARVDSELERFILSHAELKPGDKLEGKVIQVKPRNQVLIHFGKFRAVAEIAFPIKEGEIIHVVVISKRPKLQLRLESPQLNVSPGTRQLIRKLEMVPEDRWRHIRTLLQKTLNLEGELLFPPELIEALQESKENVKLKILSHSPLRLAMLLSTAHSQQVRIDFFHLRQGFLNITFYVNSEEIKKEFEKHMPEVRQNLAQRFQHLVLKVIVSKIKITEFDTEGIDNSLAGVKMLDMKV